MVTLGRGSAATRSSARTPARVQDRTRTVVGSVAVLRVLCAATGCAILVVVALILPWGLHAAHADNGDPLQLTQDTARAPTLLSPGTSSEWQLGVTTRNVSLETLTLALWANGSLVQLPSTGNRPEPLTVAVVACGTDWVGSRCSGEEWLVVPETAVTDLAGYTATLATGAGVLPAGVHLRVVVTMPETAGNETQGRGVEVTAMVVASGELESIDNSGSGGAAGHGAGLAHTGLSTVGYAVLGVAAASSGLLLARLRAVRLLAARRQRTGARV